MDFLPFYQDYLQNALSKSKFLLLRILVWLLQVHKQVRIERLAAYLPIPILHQSRRKKIQRFLVEPCLSLVLFWFPLIKLIVEQEFKPGSRLTLVLDRTQWKDKNVFMISVVWRKRSLPIYWVLLEKKGSSNVKEQIALIRPVLRLFSHYELVILGDREFHGVELSYWLKKRNRTAKNPIYFAFRERKDVYIRRSKKNQKRFQDLNLTPGVKVFEKNIFVTKQKGFGRFNVLAYQKRKYKNHSEEEPWFIITNLDDANEVIKYYKMRGGIEAMFRDYKTGGYNLEGSKANTTRLTNLILLIAIAYTASALKGKSIKNKGYQKYISRLTEPKRQVRRHSDFWVGLYGQSWIYAWDFCSGITEELMELNWHKINEYKQGLKALTAIS
ncbi:MAG: IS4 family transposase [Crocosphaera sp.]|nr:IS4 family transposase [Crocosphaera sp.]